LFTGEEIFKNVADLSGGEKGRLALAKLIYSGVNVLVLDEPTNHLDIPSREALEAALDSYPGTILAVSHDRYFLDEISTQILSFEDDARVEIFDGNYTEFHDWKERKGAELKTNTEQKGVSAEKSSESKSSVNNSNLSKNQRQTIEKRIKEIENEIPLIETKASELTAKMNKSEIIADRAELDKITAEYQANEQKTQNLYKEWEDLLEQMN
jgi:ATP-binding cassette subfamily F protein 3